MIGRVCKRVVLLVGHVNIMFLVITARIVCELRQKMKNKNKSMASIYFPLFTHMSYEHALILIESEMQEIVRICRKIETCEWKSDEDGNWNTECGECFVLVDGTPHKNGMRFCHHCGRKLIRR